MLVESKLKLQLAVNASDCCRCGWLIDPAVEDLMDRLRKQYVDLDLQHTQLSPSAAPAKALSPVVVECCHFG